MTTSLTGRVKGFTPLETIGIPHRDMMSLTGFTLIEILFVIIIIGILIGNSLPQFRKTFNEFQLNSVSLELQNFMNYLYERAIVEGDIIYLNIDKDKSQYWAYVNSKENRLKTYHIPKEINIETEQREIAFKPDGSIDKVTLRLINRDNRYVSLTTKGVFGGVKLQYQQ